VKYQWLKYSIATVAAAGVNKNLKQCRGSGDIN
jgi:hypothetical protein